MHGALPADRFRPVSVVVDARTGQLDDMLARRQNVVLKSWLACWFVQGTLQQSGGCKAAVEGGGGLYDGRDGRGRCGGRNTESAGC